MRVIDSALFLYCVVLCID